ncbi:MAG: CRTAC1 family protein [Phycisphaerales bacterium]|nr:CRTAC1 family protein [Phycisphaerales bacterium]
MTERYGLQHHATCGAPIPTQIVEVNGPGVTLFHADEDDDLDLLVIDGATLESPHHGPGVRLYLNQQNETGNVSFRDGTEHAGINLRAWGTSATAFDLEGDGDDDLYITCIGADRLLRNEGDGRFTDITLQSGIDVDGWSTGAAPGDLDGDGDLDLYVTRYVAWNFDAPPVPPTPFRGEDVIAGPTGLPAQSDRLLLNQGDGTFEDVSSSSGLNDITASYGLNAIIIDLERDGQPEILVGNDGMSNQLLVIESIVPLQVRDVGHERGFATNMSGAAQATMGMAIGDVDGNGTPDVFTSNFSSDTNTLLISESGFFADRTNAMAIGAPSRTSLGWTSRFIDFDADGDEDLIILNGHVYPNATVDSMNSTWKQVPLIMSREQHRFTPQKTQNRSWASTPNEHRAAAFGDLDDDGDLDFVVAPRWGAIQIVENNVAQDKCLLVSLYDDRIDSMNPRGLGAHITLSGPQGLQHRWMLPTSDFQGCSAAEIQFATPLKPNDALVVRWPDGIRTSHLVPQNGHVECRFSDGRRLD